MIPNKAQKQLNMKTKINNLSACCCPRFFLFSIVVCINYLFITPKIEFKWIYVYGLRHNMANYREIQYKWDQYWWTLNIQAHTDNASQTPSVCKQKLNIKKGMLCLCRHAIYINKIYLLALYVHHIEFSDLFSPRTIFY